MHDGIYLSIYDVTPQGVDPAALINFRVLKNFTKKIEHRNDVANMQKTYRFSKKQKHTVLITDYSRSRGADAKSLRGQYGMG